MVGALDDKTLVLTGSATPPPRRWWLWAPRRTGGSSSADAMCQAQSCAQGASRPRLGHVQRCLMCRFCDDIFVENPSAQLGDGLAVVSRGDGEGSCSQTKPPMENPLYTSSLSSHGFYGSGVVARHLPPPADRAPRRPSGTLPRAAPAVPGRPQRRRRPRPAAHHRSRPSSPPQPAAHPHSRRSYPCSRRRTPTAGGATPQLAALPFTTGGAPPHEDDGTRPSSRLRARLCCSLERPTALPMPTWLYSYPCSQARN